ncbi:TPA: DUF2063 domain-containing protein [Legionella pneumophila]|nr:hypothetical protein [Legionella pneumophila]HAU0163555.1 hypothetical protein [Legionella pneumophila]
MAVPPGVTLKQMALYKTLLFNNFNDIIRPCFPVLTSIVPQSIWAELLQDFLANHHATTPLFHQVAHEFVSFLKGIILPDYPFCYALAHYEWTELDIETQFEQDTPIRATQSIPLLDTPLRLKATARLLHYPYDVEHISKNYQPKDPVDTFLLVYRDVQYQIQFIKLNRLSYTVLHLMQEEQQTPRQTIRCIKDSYPSLDLNHLVSMGSIFIAGLYDEGVLHLE